MHTLVITGPRLQAITLQHQSEIEVLKQYDQLRAENKLQGYTHWTRKFTPVPDVRIQPRYKRDENLRN